MCEEIRRVKRELMYKGTVLEVYKDSMEFAITKSGTLLNIMEQRQ